MRSARCAAPPRPWLWTSSSITSGFWRIVASTRGSFEHRRIILLSTVNRLRYLLRKAVFDEIASGRVRSLVDIARREAAGGLPRTSDAVGLWRAWMKFWKES